MLVLLCADSAYPIIFSFLSLTLGSLELLGLLFSRVFPSILHSRKFVSQLPNQYMAERRKHAAMWKKGLAEAQKMVEVISSFGL